MWPMKLFPVLPAEFAMQLLKAHRPSRNIWKVPPKDTSKRDLQGMLEKMATSALGFVLASRCSSAAHLVIPCFYELHRKMKCIPHFSNLIGKSEMARDLCICLRK